MVDTRVKELTGFQRLLMRPEMGAICGVVLVLIFFMLIASDNGMFNPDGIRNWSVVSAQFAIIAVGACLLMIAGEFDLSVGSMIGFSGMVLAIGTIHFGLPVWLSICIAFVLSISLGAVNGFLVIKTGLPSFIVTLAFLYILRGLTIFMSVTTTSKTILSGMRPHVEQDWLAPFFGGEVLTGLFRWMGDNGWIETFSRGAFKGQPVVSGVPNLILWAIGLVIVGHFILTKTRFGNWIFAAGGDKHAAQYAGIPVNRVKILMFMFSAFCACVFAMCQVTEFGSAGADRGLLKEFEAIICVVIGGALLTGGYGSVIGAGLGAVMFGVVQQGLFFSGAESSLFRVFLGGLLLVAVITNTYIRRKVIGAGD
ncbi:MAG: simple sugar transport system permease protein [bacterium]|jgi:simple sugar transport system permease protein